MAQRPLDSFRRNGVELGADGLAALMGAIYGDVAPRWTSDATHHSLDAEMSWLTATEPLPPAVRPAVRGHATGVAQVGGSETIVVVDDEAVIRTATRRILERAGYRVLEAADGFEAFTVVNGGHVDLLLTDVMVPGGLSGRDLVSRLRLLHPALRILYMSGYSADILTARGILDEGVTVAEKPFSAGELLAKVRLVLA